MNDINSWPGPEPNDFNGADINELVDEEDGLEKDDESPYCPTCGACGEAGCCPPNICEKMNCLYYKNYIEDYEFIVKELNSAYEKIGDLRVANFTLAKENQELRSEIESLRKK